MQEIGAPARFDLLPRQLPKHPSLSHAPLLGVDHYSFVSTVLIRSMSQNSLTTLTSGIFNEVSLLSIP